MSPENLNLLNQTVLARCGKIEAQIKELQQIVAKHKAQAEQNQITSWGCAGELRHFSCTLAELPCMPQ